MELIMSYTVGDYIMYADGPTEANLLEYIARKVYDAFKIGTLL